MKAIFKKDFKSFWSGMAGWITTAFIMACLGLYFSGVCVTGQIADFSFVLNNVIFIFLVIVPILTMRSLVEERRQKTDQLLLTSPVTCGGIVFGKYFAILAVYALPIFASVLFPIILSFYGEVSFTKSIISILMFFLMGAAAISIGLFISGLTDSIPLAAAGTFGVLLACYINGGIVSLFSSTAKFNLFALLALVAAVAILVKYMTKSFAVSIATGAAGAAALLGIYFLKPALLEGALNKLVSSFALFTPFNDIVTGVFDLSSVVYYISVSLLFVFLTIQSLEKRRAG